MHRSIQRRRSVPAAVLRRGGHALLTLLLTCSLVALVDTPAAAVEHGDLSGQVVDAAGGPLLGVEVAATPVGSTSPVSRTDTESEGRWALSLPTGRYDLRFTDPGDRYEPRVLTDVEVALGEPTEVTPATVLSEVTRTQVSGTVRGGGSPLADATVTLVRGVGGRPPAAEIEIVATVQTDDLGRYEFVDVAVGPGRWYAVGAEAPGFQETYLGGASEPGSAEYVELTAGRTTFPALTLRVDPVLTGVVSGPDGPVEDVHVNLYRWEDEPTRPQGGQFMLVNADTTDARGRYRVQVSPGMHALHVDPTFSSHPLLEFWRGGSRPATPLDPGVFDVPDPAVSQVFDVTLLPAPAARGRVVRNGVGLPEVWVTPVVWQEATADEPAHWQERPGHRTGPDGRFSVPLPPDAHVTFLLDPPTGRATYLDGRDELPTAPKVGVSVWSGSDGLALGTLDLAAPSIGEQQVSGHVTDQWGRPLGDVTLDLEVAAGPHEGEPVAGDESGDDGTFGFTVLPGQYQVLADRPGCTFDTSGTITFGDDPRTLLVRGDCPALTAPTAAAAPRITGTPVVGSTITAAPGRWGAPFVAQPVQLLRDGRPLPGVEHTLTSSDVGAVFTARQLGARPDHQDRARGVVVGFDAATAESSSQTGREAAPPQPPAKAASTVALTVKKKRLRLRQRAVLVVRVRAPAPGRINGTLVVKRGKKNVRRVKVRAANRARTTVRIRIPARRLGLGRHPLRVRYTGNKVTRPSVSTPVRVRVVR